MKNSNFLTINWRDLLRSFVVAVLGALLSGLYQLGQEGAFTTDQLKAVAITAVTAGVGYLLKNFFTNSEDKPLKKEPPKLY